MNILNLYNLLKLYNLLIRRQVIFCNLRPIFSNAVLLQCCTHMNLARQWHDDSTAMVSNVEFNAVVPNSNTSQTTKRTPATK